MKDNFVKKNQLWKAKDSKKLIIICGKATGNKHWSTKEATGRKGTSHHIHEGTLQKFYVLIK